MSGRGKKQSYDKNARAHEEWMKSKKQDRPRQVWVPDLNADGWEEPTGHWEEKEP